MTHINVERLLRETPLSVEPSSIDAVHRRLFGPAKRRAPEHYEIHEELGRGGFGRVYRSIDKRYPREVALKIIHYSSARQLARLEREARALAGLAHPNIVTVFDKGIADAGVYYLATERVAGTRLDEWMHDPARRLPEILEIFAQAAEGLHHAHQRGMIHRDFKPANAIVDDDGRLRILDFGLVELAGAADSITEAAAEASETVPEGVIPLSAASSQTPPESTRSSEWSHGDGFIGTAVYAAPEQLDGARVDSRSDQFSLCVALFEACHGFRPFSGRTVLELSEQMAARKVARGTSRHRVPRWLERLLRRGLSPSPAERYEDVGKIAAILRTHLRPKPWLAMSAGVALALGLVGTAFAATRPPAIDLDWSGAWPEGTSLAGIEESYGTALSESLAAYEQDWIEARDAYARDPEREVESPMVRCLETAKQQFHGFVEDLQQPALRFAPPSVSRERLWLAVVASPEACLRGEPRDSKHDALVEHLVEAQAARLAGRYDEALARLQAVRDEPVLAHGRPAGLFGYELGLVQLRLWDPEAWYTLAAASQDTGDDRELLVEVLARQLEAGAVLDAASPGEVDTLLRLVHRRASEVGSPEAVQPLEALAEGFALFERERYSESKRAYARAREGFAALEPSPYRDLMVAQCTLNEAYVESNADEPRIDFAAVMRGLATLGTLLGEGHPKYVGHAIPVGRMLAGARRFGEAQRLLAPVATELDAAVRSGSQRSSDSRFDLVRAQAELLALDIERHDYGDALAPTARSRKATEWTARAFELGARLDALDDPAGHGMATAALEPRRVDVDRVREILLTAHSVVGDASVMARVIDRMWNDAARLGKTQQLCESASLCTERSAEEKKRATSEILEIEARLRTRCGCGVDDRPENGRSPSNADRPDPLPIEETHQRTP